MDKTSLQALTIYDAQRFDRLIVLAKSGRPAGRVLSFVVNAAFGSWFLVKMCLRRLLRPETGLPEFGERESAVPLPAVPRDAAAPSTLVTRRILIVADMALPQCRAYRVEQKAKLLARQGIETKIAWFFDADSCWKELALADAVIFYRAPYYVNVRNLLRECRRIGIKTYFDIDDLLFDEPTYARHPYIVAATAAERRSLLHGGQLVAQTMSACDEYIASTAVIGEHMQKVMHRPVHLLPNAIDPAELDVLARPWLKPRDDGRILAIYGSGSKTHDSDFEIVAPALKRLLASDERVALLLVGHLGLDGGFGAFSSRILRLPFMRRSDYLRVLSMADINLVPLVPDVFNDAKSNIKFLEASLVGVPTVASPRREFRDVIVPDVNGLLAADEGEWTIALNRLVSDGELRRRLGQKAREFVLEAYHPDRVGSALERALDIAGPRPGRKRAIVLLASSMNVDDSTLADWRKAAETSNSALVLVAPFKVADMPLAAVARTERPGVTVFAVNTDCRQRTEPAGRLTAVAERIAAVVGELSVEKLICLDGGDVVRRVVEVMRVPKAPASVGIYVKDDVALKLETETRFAVLKRYAEAAKLDEHNDLTPWLLNADFVVSRGSLTRDPL